MNASENKDWLERRIIYFFLTVTSILVVVTAVLTLLNRRVLDQSAEVRKQVEFAKQQFNYHVDQTMRHMDVGLRGYAIVRDSRYLYMSPSTLRLNHKRNNARLDSILSIQRYSDPSGVASLAKLRGFMEGYLNYFEDMVHALDRGDSVRFQQLFLEDRGAQHSPFFIAAKDHLFRFEDALDARASEEYTTAMDRSFYLQIVLLLIALPCILIVFRKLWSEQAAHQKLLLDLDQTNRKYLFDNGTNGVYLEAKSIIGTTISNLKYASDFLGRMSTGDYSQKWAGMSKENSVLNNTNLAGKILLLNDALNNHQRAEQIRNWTNEGVSHFSKILHSSDSSINSLFDQFLSAAVKYLSASLGALFLVKDGETCLQLVACYAYDRKKFLFQEVSFGEGLVGQAFLEAETVVLTDLPKEFMKITSGLGGATPRFLVIVPVKYNNEVVGVLELATFQPMKEYEVSLLETICKTFASSVINARNALKTAKLLEELRKQSHTTSPMDKNSHRVSWTDQYKTNLN